MSDEKLERGERVITSGGDRIYPKGFAVGTVIIVTPDQDNDPFLAIKIKPAADLRPAGRSIGHHEDGGGFATVHWALRPCAPRTSSRRDCPAFPSRTRMRQRSRAGSQPARHQQRRRRRRPRRLSPRRAATEQKPGIAANPLKPPLAGTGTTVPATNSKPQAAGTVTPVQRPNKAGAETQKAEYRNRFDNCRGHWRSRAWRHGNTAQTQTYAQEDTCGHH